jgi:hypothetical protein
MNIDTKQHLEKIILSHISWLFSDLEIFVRETKLIGNLTKGCWSNENGVIVGWVGYFPHNSQQEEAIELLFTLSSEIKNGKKNFDIGIYWSDGEVIQEITEFDDIDPDNPTSQIDLIIEQSKIELLLEMKKQISIERPPHYRKE